MAKRYIFEREKTCKNGNIPWVVLQQPYECSPNCWIWLVAMANERLIFLVCNIYNILAEYSHHSCTFRWVLWPMGLWFYYRNDTIHKVWLESIIWFKRQSADKLFWSEFDIQSVVWPWKWGQGHQNLIINFSCLSGVSVQVWSKSTIWFKRSSAVKAHFYSLYSVVTLKIRSRSPTSNHFFFNYSSDTIHKILPEYTIWFKR